MSSQDSNFTDLSDGVSCDATDTPSTRQAAPESPQHFRRMVELVASGELPLPQHLPCEQLGRLAREVHKLRRRRLVHFVARAVANDILKARRPKHGGGIHDA